MCNIELLKISYNQKQRGQCYSVTFLIVFLKEARPNRFASASKWPQPEITRYKNARNVPIKVQVSFFLVCSFFSSFSQIRLVYTMRSFYHLRYGLFKKCLYTEYFQSKIYQITHAPIRIVNFIASLTSRPKRFHPRQHASFVVIFRIQRSADVQCIDQQCIFVLQTTRVSWNAIQHRLVN